MSAIETLKHKCIADDSQHQALVELPRELVSLEQDAFWRRNTSAGSSRSSTGSTADTASLTVDTNGAINEILKACPVEEWHIEDFEMVKCLMKASANHGHVSLMKSLQRGGQFVVVKDMTNEWTQENHAEFLRAHPKSKEQPWLDIAITNFLHREGYPYLCEPLGVFRSSSSTYVLSSFASHGDLLGVIDTWSCPGFGRESEIRPLLHQVIMAVKHLHDIGIAHRDISAENIVVTSNDEGRMSAKLIDFGMAICSRQGQGARGKSPYMAPEMHEDGDYDAFVSDAFSVGVVGFAMATSDYPWTATKSGPGQCKIFQYVQKNGLRSFCAKRKLMCDKKLSISQTMSEPLMELLEGLLDFSPQNRLTLGEACWARTSADEARRSALTCAWLRCGQSEDTAEVMAFSDGMDMKKNVMTMPNST